MRKLTTILLLLISFSASSQIVNKFRDSTWFAKGVRFDSAIYLIKGASNGKVLTSDANGRATWQTFSGSGVSQSTLNDSISAVRSIRKVDTLYRNLDSLIFKINGLRYSIKDSSGGSSDSIYFNRTYAQLRAEMSAHSLIKGTTYKLTDFANIYDQSLSDVPKTASGETLVLKAVSDSSFSPIVSSLDFPTDIIHYDITIDTTYVNGASCKGKITYRKDVNGNSTYFDFRKVLMINYNDSTEQLFFDLSKIVTGNDMPFTKEYGITFGIEFPAAFFKDNVYQNSNNYFATSYFNGAVTQNTGNTILASNFGGEFSQNFELRIVECVFDSILLYSGEGSWSNSIFHSAVNKVVSTNFNYTEVDGLIDRVFQSGYLYDTIQGRLYWCVGIYMYACNIDGDFSGVNECAWVQTRSNCNIETINGISHQSEKIGFKDCTITGTSGSSDFGNIRIDCLVESKIISEALYPELFDTAYSKTIFKGSNGSVYYTYYNGLTYVINEII